MNNDLEQLYSELEFLDSIVVYLDNELKSKIDQQRHQFNELKSKIDQQRHQLVSRILHLEYNKISTLPSEHTIR